MELKAVCLGHSRFVVNKSEKINDEIDLNKSTQKYGGASNEYPQRMFSWRNKNNKYTFELRWLEPLWDHENLFETAVVRATEGYY